MSESINNLVDAIVSGDALGTENAFADAMSDKLAGKLDDMKLDVARNMFASPENVVELDDAEVDPVAEVESTEEVSED